MRSREGRKKLSRTLKGFCLVYFPHYFGLEPADFHEEMMADLSDHKIRFLLMIGFRGCAKSTLASMAFVIWCAVEHPDLYPFIIPIADTSMQAAISIANIKRELEQNELLKADYGRTAFDRMGNPYQTFATDDEDWQAKNMLLYTGVRILARSRGQKIRGLRHGPHRPKLVVADDIEATEWVKEKKNRDVTDRWMRGEVMPSIDEATGRLVVIGNWLHEDALLGRLKKTGRFLVREYPLINEMGHVTWAAKYPTDQSIWDKMVEMGDVAWMREMLLQIVSEEGQEVRPEDIHYYDEEPGRMTGLIGHGVDLAISSKASADDTAEVEGRVAYVAEKTKIYISQYPTMKKMTFHETMNHMQAVSKGKRGAHIFFVEDVAYQKAAIQEMERCMLAVTPMHPVADKRSRLRVAARYIKNGTVLFPRTGCERLIQQLLNFGNEAHDDGVDALVYLILGLIEQGLDIAKIVWMG